ncbi:hypothetical protein KKG71_01130 [Patescibacteria group bacterium]|nr:hypothetical protein [Patescibacteria group bacterium]
MKKIIAILGLIAIFSSFSGCKLEELKNDILGIKQDVEEKIDNVKEEVDRISKEVTDTKNKIEDKYEKGKKVLEAIDEFGAPYEGETTSPAAEMEAEITPEPTS